MGRRQHEIDLKAARQWVGAMKRLGVSQFTIGSLSVTLNQGGDSLQPRIGFIASEDDDAAGVCARKRRK